METRLASPSALEAGKEEEKRGFASSQEPALLLPFGSCSASQMVLVARPEVLGSPPCRAVHSATLGVVSHQLRWMVLLFTDPVLLPKTTMLRFLEKSLLFIFF